MKKFTFFLSLFLTVSGVATTNAQNTFLKPEDITDGRVIALRGVVNGDATNSRYVTLNAAGLAGFDPKETAVVVEKAEEDGKFYLKKYSNGQYLQQKTSTTNQNEITLGDKGGAASFKVTKVQRSSGSNETNLNANFTDPYATIDDVIRFVTFKEDGTMTFLNTNGGATPALWTGQGANSIFVVYDAAECCKNYYEMASEDVVYVGDIALSEDKKNALQTAYYNYNNEKSEANYTAVVESAPSPAAFDANLYYLIENNQKTGYYMETTDDEKLVGTSGISGSASQIWHLEAVKDETDKAEFKYYLYTQGVYCGEPSRNIQVNLSNEKQTSFYMITAGSGVFAFDCQFNDIRAWGDNNCKGLLLNYDNDWHVEGFGTKPANSQWKLKFAKTCTVEMPAEGWTTLNLPFAVRLPEGLTASYPTYAEKGTSVNSVTMAELKGNEIPAEFPVVLQGEAGTTYTLTILPADKVVSTEGWAENKFEGVLLPKTVNTEAMYNLELNDGETFTLVDPKEGESDVTVAANSAYLPKDNVTTGITDVVAADTNADNVWFDLVGRRVLNPAKGVYVNAAGKKALFK